MAENATIVSKVVKWGRKQKIEKYYVNSALLADAREEKCSILMSKLMVKL